MILSIVFSDWAQLLSVTLFYSIWIGAISSLFAVIVTLIFNKHSARKRYNIFLGIFVISILSIIFCFLKMAYSIPGATDKFSITTATENNVTGSILNYYNNIYETNSQTIEQFFSKNASSVIACWLLIIFLKTIRLGIGISLTSKITRQSVAINSSALINKLHLLTQQLNIRKKVGLNITNKVRSPSLTGIFKPIILFPAGLLTRLTPEETEAILLHELAHIKRNDVIINLLQEIICIIFFFNPGILWLSSLIRQERENCCDDLALCSSRKTDYIKALVTTHEFAFPKMAYAVAFASSRQGLLYRVKRLLSYKQTKFSNMEKIAIISSFIFCFIMGTVVSTEKKRDIIEAPSSSHFRYTNRPIPQEESQSQFNPVQQVLFTHMASSGIDTPPREKYPVEKVKNNNANPLIIPGGDSMPVVSSNEAAGMIYSERNKEHNPKSANPFNIDVHNTDKVAQQQNNIPAGDNSGIADIKGGSLKTNYLPSTANTPDDETEKNIRLIKEKINKAKEESSNRVMLVLNYLENKKVIPDNSRVHSYKLTAAELVVNGIKQPGQVHIELLNKLGITAGDILIHNSEK